MKLDIFIKNNQKTYQCEKDISIQEFLLKNQELKFLKNAFCVVLDDELLNLNENLTKSCQINFVLPDGKKNLNQSFNLSCALFLAGFLQTHYSKSYFIVNLNQDNFVVDFDTFTYLNKIGLDELKRKFDEYLQKDHNYLSKVVTKKASLDTLSSHQYHKIYLKNLPIISSQQEEITFYKKDYAFSLNSIFHINNSKFLLNYIFFNATTVYFNNDLKKPMQRISGACRENKAILKKYIHELDLQKQNDHRTINQQLRFFATDLNVGQGLPIWLPNGQHVFKKIETFLLAEEKKAGYHHVLSPVLGSLDLYKKSGHYAHYKENMFPFIKTPDNEELVLRPMTCPHHCIAFSHLVKSYQELPYRIAENSHLFRYESSGSLSGLERTRVMCLNDGHIFLKLEDINKEFTNILRMTERILNKFNIKLDYYRLSFRDQNNKEKYYPDDAMWKQSESELKNVLNQLQVNYQIAENEAAFYGPKLDLQIKNNNNHDVTLATIQLDFLLTKSLNITYYDKDQQLQHPIIIHRSFIGTFERLFATLLEQNSGYLPFWLNPYQFVVISLNETSHEYAKALDLKLKNAGYESTLDISEKRLSYKIRKWQMQKSNYQLIIGQKEVHEQTVSWRKYGDKQTFTLPLEEFFQNLENNYFK